MVKLSDDTLELPDSLTEYGSLNVPALTRLRTVLTAAANDTHAPVLAVSLANVHWAGAAFIGIVVETHNQLQRTGRRLKLCNVGKGVLELLTICRLTEMFSV
jgi:anti-anti-sigma factor